MCGGVRVKPAETVAASFSNTQHLRLCCMAAKLESNLDIVHDIKLIIVKPKSLNFEPVHNPFYPKSI